MKKILFKALLFCSSSLFALPKDFAYLKDIDPSIKQKMMYFSFENFVGEKIEGYKKPTCILTKKAALALKAAQQDLLSYGLSFLIFDCYRPQRAVNHFVEFSKKSETKTQKVYYPHLTKSRMFEEGYVASKSGHSRGSTVDLTIIPLNSKEEYYQGCLRKTSAIDFGTGIDCMDPLSNTFNSLVTGQAKINRVFLVDLMKRHGFKNLAEEWWHYTLIEEPFPDTYFDFLIE